jgi:hypothetical protein
MLAALARKFATASGKIEVTSYQAALAHLGLKPLITSDL